MAGPTHSLALYERILALVNPQELQLSCNEVLQDDISAVQNAVDDVVAVFAKVEEVREAVKQLEQGKGSTGRSASLMEVLGSAMELQKGLGEKLGQMATGMKVAEEEKKEKKEKMKEKRKWKDEKQKKEERESSSSEEAEEPEEKKQKKEKKEKKESPVEETMEKGSADLQVAHDCLNAITTVKTINKQIQFDMQGQWEKAVVDIGRILQRQAKCDPYSTDKPAAEVTARALEAAAVVFRKVELSGERVKEIQTLLATLKGACASNKLLRVYFHRVRAQLESLEMGIPFSSTKSVESSVNSNSAVTSKSKSLEQQVETYQKLARGIRSLREREKPKRILEALEVMEQVMTDDNSCALQGQVRSSVEHVRCWVNEVQLQSNLTQAYLRFADKLSDYSKHMNSEMQVGWQRLAAGIVALLERDTEPSGAKTSHSPTTTSKSISDAGDRLTTILAELEQWQDGIFSLDQFDKLVQKFSGVVSLKSKEWNPLTDPAVRTAVEKMRACIQMIKKQSHRDKRLKTVNKWKASIDNYR